MVDCGTKTRYPQFAGILCFRRRILSENQMEGDKIIENEKNDAPLIQNRALKHGFLCQAK